MRRLSVTSVLAGLVLAVTTWTSAAPAEAAQGDGWHPGFCAEGEGVAIVIDFRSEDRRDWPNGAGYDVRCLFGPQVANLNLSDPRSPSFRNIPGRAGVPGGSSGGRYFGLEGNVAGTTATIGSGWSSAGVTSAGNNVDRFVGLTYTRDDGATPILEPQFSRLGGGGSGPDPSPTPGAPSTGGVSTPDRVGGATPDRVGSPRRASDPDRSEDPEDPEDPDARAPGGEAGAEGAEETPEPSESPESDQALTGTSQSQDLESTDSLTGGPTWLWVTVIALVVVVYLAVTVLVVRARKAARLTAGS